MTAGIAPFSSEEPGLQCQQSQRVTLGRLRAEMRGKAVQVLACIGIKPGGDVYAQHGASALLNLAQQLDQALVCSAWLGGGARPNAEQCINA